MLTVFFSFWHCLFRIKKKNKTQKKKTCFNWLSHQPLKLT